MRNKIKLLVDHLPTIKKKKQDFGVSFRRFFIIYLTVISRSSQRLGFKFFIIIIQMIFLWIKGDLRLEMSLLMSLRCFFRHFQETKG
jgi:hypothetical protein